MKIRVTENHTETVAEFEIPGQEEGFTLYVAALIRGLEESRIHPWGYAGQAIEIRRMPKTEYHLEMVAEESECEIGCTCIMCIPGA